MQDYGFATFWTGASLSPYEWMCLASFPRHGHDLTLFTLEPHLEVPAGVELADAGDLLGAERQDQYRQDGKVSPAMFAGVFVRLSLLKGQVGWGIPA